MTSAELPVLKDEIHRYFDLFTPTVALVERLISAKENAQEVLLLLCGRLDALASSLSAEGQSNRDCFTHLVVSFGGERRFASSVSAGDLYYELGYHRWLIEGLLPKPGRIERRSRLDDPIIDLLELSEIPLTAQDGHALLTRLMKAVERCSRCRPGQRRKKPSTLQPGVLVEAFRSEFRKSRTVDAEKLPNAIQPLLRSKTVAALLYENFRNAAVHGVKVEFDERRFFTEPRPFWQPLYSEYYPPFMFLKFSANFLLTLLRNCMRTVRESWVAKGRVPPDVHWHLFGPGWDKLRLLDAEQLPEPRTLRVQRNRS